MLSAFFGKFGFYLLLVTASLIAIAIVMRNCRKMLEPPRPPKIKTVGPLDVVDVPTGASILVAAGRRGRTRTITLEGVAAPASGSFAQISADHLRGMAGDQVTVQYERHGLFRGNPQASLPQQEEASEVAVETPALLEVEVVCSGCKGKGEETLTRVDMISAGMSVWMTTHKCEQCQKALDANGGREDFCDAFQAKLKALTERFGDFQPVVQTCSYCGGSGVLCEYMSAEEFEARGPLTGVCFGASGICLNVEQIKGGYVAITAGYDAPKEWHKAEAAAKKAKTGVWR